MGEERGTLPEQNTYFDKTILSFARVVERYIHPWRFGKTDWINDSQFDRCSFNKMAAINCQSSEVPIERPFIKYSYIDFVVISR